MEGEPVFGILHSADASAGVVVPLYKQGSRTAYTIKVDEYIEVHSIELISAAGGDCRAYFGTNGTPATASDILRGTVGTTSGELKSIIMRTGFIAENVWCIAPAGVVDLIFNGTIRSTGNINPRKGRESLVPGA